MSAFHLPRRSSNKAAALIIVLAFVVLLTGVALTFFSRTASERQLAHSSYNDTSADLLARTALDTIVSDFKQEIVNGSTATIVNGSTVYAPSLPAYVVPLRSGNLTEAPNLIRRSIRSDPILAPPGIGSRASAVNSTTDVSANGRFVTPARWNSHYLIPKQNTGTDDSIPIDAFANATPDWVFVTDQGPTVFTSTVNDVPSSSVVGRYAYAVYDEGGLLDVNVAGYPTDPSADPIPTQRVGRKGSLAYADLTALPYPIPNGSGVYQVDKIVGWRNYGTTRPSGFFPTGLFASNFLIDPTRAAAYFTSIISNTNGFLSPSTATWNNQTDQLFVQRQELIAFRSPIGFSVNALQYLGTFSREQNIPTWLPSLPSTSLLTRFPVSELAVVSQTPPLSGNATEIKTYFGLQWSSTNGRWQYVEGGSVPVSAISPVGSGQANLFQALNYLLPGNTIANILSLGACIIDQYDVDATTTQIEYGSGVPTPIAYGMEAPDSLRPPDAPPPPAGYIVLNRTFRNVGELGYAFNPITGSKLNFHASPSSNADARLLDFFTMSAATLRAGIVSLNTRNPYVLAAIIKGAITTESSSATVSATDATAAAISIVTNPGGGTIVNPAITRADVARLASPSVVSNPPFTTSDETRETIARALAEIGQTRTWGLLIDVVAQTGHFKPAATSLQNDFIVEGEEHYWVHVAIDRFTGQVLERQFEAVKE